MPGKWNLSRQQKRQLRRFPVAARQLPDHPDTFTTDQIELERDAFSAFAHSDVIEPVADYWSDTPTEWQPAPQVHEFVENELYDGTRTPCQKGAGVRCLKSGELYTCNDDDCDCRFGHDTAHAVVYDEPLPPDTDTRYADEPEVAADGGQTCQACGGTLEPREGCTVCQSCGNTTCGGGDRV